MFTRCRNKKNQCHTLIHDENDQEILYAFFSKRSFLIYSLIVLCSSITVLNASYNA